MRKGFTLVELLAIVVILSFIALITLPNIISVINSSKNSLNETQKTAVENSASTWGLKNVSLDNNGNPSPNWVTIKTLQDAGFLDKKELKLTGSSLTSSGVCIKYSNNQFVYKYADKKNKC